MLFFLSYNKSLLILKVSRELQMYFRSSTGFFGLYVKYSMYIDRYVLFTLKGIHGFHQFSKRTVSWES